MMYRDFIQPAKRWLVVKVLDPLLLGQDRAKRPRRRGDDIRLMASFETMECYFPEHGAAISHHLGCS
jgi:hypothetical protein